MTRWRIAVVLALLATPLLVLLALGSFYLWREGLTLVVWCPLLACLGVGYALAARWQRQQRLLKPVDWTPPEHATERDRLAWERIERRAEAAKELSADQLADPQFYFDVAQELARDLASHYHHNSPDFIASVTVPEILAVIELAAHDLGEMVERYLPGGHLLTIHDWQRAKQVSDWYRSANQWYWAISGLLSPVNTATRYLVSRVGVSTPFKMLQQHLLLWFYTAYLQRLGLYLIELYSGRLRVGASRWREMVLERQRPPGTSPAAPAAEPQPLRVTLIGQVKVGKSSLINALLGERRAAVDVLPTTNDITSYRLRTPDLRYELLLHDTPGYHHEGPRPDALSATLEMAQQSDLLLLVLHARNPGRQADRQVLQALHAWFAEKPERKRPPIVGVLTHMDLLSPAMEWAPPYDWQNPQRPKERHLHEALQVVREQLGEHLDIVVPVCTATGKIHGIEESLLPALASRLDQVQVAALLRCLHEKANEDQIGRLFTQFLSVGKAIGQKTLEQFWGKENAERPGAGQP